MITTKAALKINNFGNKYPSYVIVARVKLSQVNQNEQNKKQNKNKPSPNTEINNEMIMVLQGLNNQVQILTILLNKVCSDQSPPEMQTQKKSKILEKIQDKQFIANKKKLNDYVTNIS